ncbi:YqaJ viral recombinase family nuclease [Salibacterium sp. K-3]
MSVVVTQTKDMNKADWLKWRKKGIGGSDASAVLGVNKYKSPFEVWNEKTEEHVPDEEDPSEAAYFGNRLEDLVAEEFQMRTGKRVRRKNAMMQHPDYPFMLANVDRVIVREDAILECKTANQFLAKDWEEDQIPDAYLVQVQHYLAVTGKSKAYIAVLIGGQKFVWKEIERDEELINMIIQQEKNFWENHVMANVPPALDGSSAAEQYLNERFPQQEKEKVTNLGVHEKEALQRLDQIKADIKMLENEEKEIKNNIKWQMQDAELGYVNGYEVSWKNITANKVDTAKLKREKPALADAYTYKSQYRKFTYKAL